MTARDEAIEAMATKVIAGHRLAPALCGNLLDAISPAVKARLAIEEGGLELVRLTHPSTLYRMVEP